MLTGVTPPEEATLTLRSAPPGSTCRTETWLLPASAASRNRPPSANWTAPCEARPAPVPAPPALNGDPGIGVRVPSACRLNPAIVFAPAVPSSRYTCPVTGDRCTWDADADTAGTATAAVTVTPAAAVSHRRFPRLAFLFSLLRSLMLIPSPFRAGDELDTCFVRP